MADKPTLYLDSSIFTYLVGRWSRDITKLNRQLVTRRRWDLRRREYRLCIPPSVIGECLSPSGPADANRRQRYLNSAVILRDCPEIRALATALYAPLVPLPDIASPDAVHLATAAFHRCKYLATWNFHHIANATISEKVDNILRAKGYAPSKICTLEQLFS